MIQELINFIKKLKRYILPAIGVIVLVSLMGSFFRSCKMSDKYTRLQGKYDLLIEQKTAEQATLDQTIQEKTTEIAVLSGEVESLQETIIRRNVKQVALGKTISALESKAVSIPVLQEQVSVWKVRFSLAEQTIADQERIIFSLTGKYDAQVQISTAWEQKYKLEHTAWEACEDLNSQLRRDYLKVKALNKVGKFVTWGVIGVVAASLAVEALGARK